MFTCSVPVDPVSARLGHVATVPCWLTPSMNAEGLEVRWYRPKDFDNPVLHYRDRKIQEASLQSQYVGRSSLGLREVTSEGLKGGDVTLKLVNVTLRDQGEYVCYVSSNQDYEIARLQTAVIILALLLLLSVVFIGVLYKKRGQGYVFGFDIHWHLLILCLSSTVDVTLDPKTAPPYLTVGLTGKIVRDSKDNPCPPGEHAYILGTHGFTSGSHAYWEVRLDKEKVGVKESWWVGLASGPVKRQGDVPATPSNGFWFLSSDKEKFLRLNMAPDILLPANPRPRILGVYFDYDQGVLSFINVKDNKLIVTVRAMFIGELFPLFNPGQGDTAPMTILDTSHYKTEPVEVSVSERESKPSGDISFETVDFSLLQFAI
uniref:Uncharacterized protein n=1 Tax=Oncorhynchus tshawytscha TaxID=74940 RepID=A0A8C8F5L2_ONCTS